MTEPAPPLPDPLPLFPLRMVLFPGAMLGLKVFEARYLDLVSRCLRTGEPFGVPCLRDGAEAGPNASPVQLETVGTLAWLEEVDSEQPGILRVRCRAGRRFRRIGDLDQRPDGLWLSKAELLAEDPPRQPGAAMQQAVSALQQAVASLDAQDIHPFLEPLRYDDAGWVANRWCELLPLPLAAKQKLMELDDPTIRLSLVDAFLRDKKIVIG